MVLVLEVYNEVFSVEAYSRIAQSPVEVEDLMGGEVQVEMLLFDYGCL